MLTVKEHSDVGRKTFETFDYFTSLFSCPTCHEWESNRTGRSCCVNIVAKFKSKYLTPESLAPLQVQPTSLLQTSGYWAADSVLKFPANQRCLASLPWQCETRSASKGHFVASSGACEHIYFSPAPKCFRRRSGVLR